MQIVLQDAKQLILTDKARVLELRFVGVPLLKDARLALRDYCLLACVGIISVILHVLLNTLIVEPRDIAWPLVQVLISVCVTMIAGDYS